MKKATPILATIILFFGNIALQAQPVAKTKVVVQSVSQKQIQTDAPCYIVFPEGADLETIEDSQIPQNIEATLRKMGYPIVADESAAVIFVNVKFETHEAFETEIKIKERGQIDYSNSASTKNYAAILGGGRYNQVAQAQNSSQNSDLPSILGPDGKIIDLAEQGTDGAEFKEGRDGTLIATIRPITFQVSAWSFDKVKEGQKPEQLWAVRTTYNNLREEDTVTQLEDLYKIASKYFGKNLKKEKLVTRK
ncbi:hypothetical protein [Pelagicoccus mobilis]|uniref:Uncharacterized protein n=1 Tax=Pelagicoccus mobilis TaxID=415221 RepID=A0A934RV96_9BACT|nr:hypothetical protein [Pelagicoccus mobilis]MBK1878320.1 hypothetical protein [Pelagicoccus mobilis]